MSGGDNFENEKQQQSRLKKYESIVALSVYCFASISMTLLNKAVLSSHNFKMNFFLLTVQSCVSVLLLGGCKLCGLLKYRPLRKDEAIKWFPVSLLLVSMIYTGSKSLQFLSVAMFTVFKNLAIILVALGEQTFFASPITLLMWLSFAMMVSSSVLGGFNDLTFNLKGYIWMGLNAFSSASYLLYMKSCIKKVGFADFDSVYYNNMLALPVMIALSIALEDWSGFYKRFFTTSFIASGNWKLVLGMICSGFSSFLINFGTAWCVRVCASTTYSMAGALNKLPVAISGMLFFSAERKSINPGYLVSIGMSFAAGCVYSWAQILKRKAADRLRSKKVAAVQVNSDKRSEVAVAVEVGEVGPLLQKTAQIQK